jgi:alcohol dehydrogenase class IV
MAVFHYSNPAVIHWGAGSLARLRDELDRLRARRVVIVTTRSLLTARSPDSGEGLITDLRQAMGDASSPVTVQISQHAPLAEVETAIDRAAEAKVDGVVSFGGGSPIDAAKIVAVRLADRRKLDDALPHVAIPTTLSVAELASGAGYTDPGGTKAGVRDPRLLPQAVIYDAELTLTTPPALWLSTGIRALDHAVEGFLADGEHPFSDVMALEGMRRLFRSLPAAKARPKDLAVRTENQLAAWFSFTLPGASASGLSHTMGKQIGARHRIPHGVTSCLLLPHVMRYLAAKKPDRMQALSAATGGDGDAPGDVDRLIASLGLPQHIAEYGIGEPELAQAAGELAGTYPEPDLMKIYLAAL